MKIAVLRESKLDAAGREVENRIILVPGQVLKLSKVAEVLIEKNAGLKSGYPDAEYEKTGARIISHDEALSADLILGVKETKEEDFPKLKKNIFMSFQHFAESQKRTQLAQKTGATFVCLETIEVEIEGKKRFPCLAPMSEAAARVVARHADWFALHSLKTIGWGKKLKAVILGAGMVGQTAAHELGLRGYEVHLIDRVSLKKLPSSIAGAAFAVSSMYNAGRSPEKLITKELLMTMLPGGCVYPVDIDQGGGIEGAMQTSILEPFNLPKIPGTEIFCFAPPNLPSLGARTTSEALGAAILPYVLDIIKGKMPPGGINIENGKIIHPGLR
jgi:alanine dehydrogenase